MIKRIFKLLKDVLLRVSLATLLIFVGFILFIVLAIAIRPILLLIMLGALVYFILFRPNLLKE